jgi:hypothetical protein
MAYRNMLLEHQIGGVPDNYGREEIKEIAGSCLPVLETKGSGRISEEIDEQAVADSCSAWWSSGMTGPYGDAPVS